MTALEIAEKIKNKEIRIIIDESDEFKEFCNELEQAGMQYFDGPLYKRAISYFRKGWPCLSISNMHNNRFASTYTGAYTYGMPVTLESLEYYGTKEYPEISLEEML